MVPLAGEIYIQNVFVRQSFYVLASFCVAGVGGNSLLDSCESCLGEYPDPVCCG